MIWQALKACFFQKLLQGALVLAARVEVAKQFHYDIVLEVFFNFLKYLPFYLKGFTFTVGILLISI